MFRHRRRNWRTGSMFDAMRFSIGRSIARSGEEHVCLAHMFLPTRRLGALVYAPVLTPRPGARHGTPRNPCRPEPNSPGLRPSSALIFHPSPSSSGERSMPCPSLSSHEQGCRMWKTSGMSEQPEESWRGATAGFVSPRHADARPKPCEETPFRNDLGPDRSLLGDAPERTILETTQCWIPKSAGLSAELFHGRGFPLICRMLISQEHVLCPCLCPRPCRCMPALPGRVPSAARRAYSRAHAVARSPAAARRACWRYLYRPMPRLPWRNAGPDARHASRRSCLRGTLWAAEPLGATVSAPWALVAAGPARARGGVARAPRPSPASGQRISWVGPDARSVTGPPCTCMLGTRPAAQRSQIGGSWLCCSGMHCLPSMVVEPLNCVIAEFPNIY